MGIKGLFQLLQKHAPQAIDTVQLSHLSGQTIAIDSSVTMYQFLTATQYLSKNDEIREMQDANGNPTSHLMGIFNRTTTLLKRDISPLWVFDGPVSPLKETELQRRREHRVLAQKRMEQSQDMKQKLKYKVQTVRLTEEMKSDAQKMLSLLGLPWVESKGEGEALCAHLSHLGSVDMVASEDLDTLPFGATSLLKGLNQNKDTPIHQISLQKALQHLDLTMHQFIDLCILSGCDFADKIAQVGPHKALGLIKKFQHIEGILSHITEQQNLSNPKYVRFVIPSSFLNDFQNARNMFSMPHEPQINYKKECFEIRKVPQSFYDFMVYEKRFKQERVNKALLPLLKG